MAQIKVMCLGDEATRGDEANPGGHRSYRGRLLQRLQAAGYDVDFVGSQTLTPALGGSDGAHEGYIGAGLTDSIAGVASLSSRLSTIFAANTPDVVILQAGWQDVVNNPTTIGTRYGTLVEAIEAVLPSARILMTTLTPYRGETESQTNARYSAYQTLNTAIRTLAANNVTGQRYLADPAGLTNETDLTIWVQAMIDDVKLQPDFWDGSGITLAGGGRIPNAYGGIECSSFAGMTAANNLWSTSIANFGQGASGVTQSAASDGPGHPRFINNVAAVVPWPWVFAVQGHASTNTGVELRNLFAAVRRTSGTWVFMFQGARAFGFAWNPGAAGALQRYQPDGITTFLKPAGNTGWEVWARDTSPSRGGISEFYGAFNRAVLADASCFFVGCQMRLALDNPTGANDTAAARIVAKVGFDTYATIGNPHYDYGGFPRNMMDGGSGRWKRIASTNWVWVLTVTADCHWVDSGVPPPWGFWSGSWAYKKAPLYAITEAQLRANPPPLPSFREPTDTIGSGFQSGDYFGPILMLQSGADKVADAIYAGLTSDPAILDDSGTTPTSPLLSRPSQARWKPRATSGRANWRVASSENFTPPALTTGAYPTVTRNTAYTAASSATGSAPIAWSASGLPAGLTMNASNGTISGTTAASAGDYAVTITLINEGAPTGVQFTRTITVAALGSSVVITTAETLVAGLKNQAYSVGLEATGTGPFVWETVGNPPTGFELLADGTFRGLPRASGVFSFTAKVTGADESTASRTFTLVVANNEGDRWVRLAPGLPTWTQIPR